MADRRLTPYHRLFPDTWPRWVVTLAGFGCIAAPFLAAWVFS